MKPESGSDVEHEPVRLHEESKRRTRAWKFHAHHECNAETRRRADPSFPGLETS